jgi:ATP-dependent DNA helicase RecG
VRKGECSILIGTHALLEGDVIFHKLGLIIIDEQHRFGFAREAVLR